MTAIRTQVSRVRQHLTRITPTCDTCRWADVVIASVFEVDEAEEEFIATGEHEPMMICRRLPPIDTWPEVDSSDWCGEHRKR